MTDEVTAKSFGEMIGSDGYKGDESPHYEGMHQSGNGAVSDYFGLEQNFKDDSFNPGAYIVVSEFSGSGFDNAKSFSDGNDEQGDGNNYQDCENNNLE